MNDWQDIKSGFIARPASTLALAAIGIIVGLFASIGTRIWHQADQESKRLLSAWPPDRTSIELPTRLDQDERALFLQRLPPGTWWAWTQEDEILWAQGSLPQEYRPVEGVPLQPDLMTAGVAVGLVSTTSSWSLHEIVDVQGVGFQVLGKVGLPESVRVILPHTIQTSPTRNPLQVEVRLEAADIVSRIRDLPFFEDLSLVDHRQARKEARKGFRRLSIQLTLLAGVAALLTAIILQSLIRLELRERRFEFALRRSLGAQPSDIRIQILTEIGLSTGLPSLLGILFFLPALPPAGWSLALIVPGWFLLCALPPAHHAASLPPHQALKEG